MIDDAYYFYNKADFMKVTRLSELSRFLSKVSVSLINILSRACIAEKIPSSAANPKLEHFGTYQHLHFIQQCCTALIRLEIPPVLLYRFHSIVFFSIPSFMQPPYTKLDTPVISHSKHLFCFTTH